MKLILEINTTEKKDVEDALKALRPLTDENTLCLNESKNIKDIKDERKDVIETSSVTEEVYLEEYDVVNNADISINNKNDEKIKELKEEKKKLLAEKKEIIKENATLKNKVKELETEIEGKPSEDFDKQTNNKSWEEIKQLRAKLFNLQIENKKLEDENSQLKTVANIPVINQNQEENNKTIEALQEELNNEKEKNKSLAKTSEYNKERSIKNWNDLKEANAKNKKLTEENNNLKEEIKKITESNDININKDELEKTKLELFNIKSEYEGKISELKLSNDKLQNELNLCQANFSDEMLKELEHLRAIKNAICLTEQGQVFWKSVEYTVLKN